MNTVGKMSLNEDEIEMIHKLQNYGILNRKITCIKCKNDVDSLVYKKRDENGSELISFRCKKCQKYKTIKDNSFFSMYKTPITLNLQIIKFWCVQLPLVKVKELLLLEANDSYKKGKEKNTLTLSLPVIGSIYRNMRSLCSHSMLQLSCSLGGDGKFVELDESLVAKVKYNVGKALGVEQIWLFGLVERGKNGKFSE